MQTPASIAGHPIHSMLVPIAIGCFIFSFASDVIFFASGDSEPWNTLAYYTMIGGILGALVAAVPGMIDMFSLSSPIRSTAFTHMAINLAVIALFIVSAWMRHGNGTDLQTPMLFSLVAILMLGVSGWLGGKMVYEAGVGVSRDAIC